MQGDSVVRILRDINVRESVRSRGRRTAPHVDVRSCPVALRSKLKRTEDDDIDAPELDDEDDSEEDRCECDCQNCQDGDCGDCTEYRLRR